MANPEAPKNPESPEPREELNRLESQVSGDHKKFETLSKNSSVKKGIEKIMKKGLESKIGAFIEISNGRFDYYIGEMIKSHPELISFIAGELKLPVKIGETDRKTLFSQLSFEQQIKFLALVNFYWDNVKTFKNISSSKIIEGYWKYIQKFTEDSTERLNNTMGNNKNFIGYVNIKEVLKKEYGLTDTESEKVEEYIKIIAEHPEYLGGGINLPKMQLAMSKGGFLLIGIFIGIVMSVLGYGTYKYLTNVVKTVPAETRVYGDHTEITNFKETFKVMSAITSTDSFEREFKENGFDHVHMGLDILKPAEWLINKGVDLGNRTGIANRDLTLRIKCDNYHVFNFENMRCFVEKKDGVRVVRVTGVKKPEIITNVTNVEVLESHREIIHRQKFDDFDFKAQEILKKEANETANSPEQIKKAEESLAKHILSVFQSTGCCNSDIAVKGEDIQGIIIEFEDNEHPRYVNIEGKGKHINN